MPTNNKKGDNPPHAKAKSRYEEIVDTDHFLCTGEHPNEDDPKPIVFEFTEDGFSHTEPEDDSDNDNKDEESKSKSSRSGASLATAIDTAQGSSATPSTAVGYGRPE